MWFRLSRKADDPTEIFGHIESGRMMVMLDRGDYWQCAYVIPKGGIDDVKHAGVGSFREAVGDMSPFLRDRLDEIESWDDVKLLTVAVDRLRRWYRPGLLCIGDAAHAMSPIGGVGINLAVQDAVAAANILAGPLSGAKRRPKTSTACSGGATCRRRAPSACRLSCRTTSSVRRSRATADGRKRPGSCNCCNGRCCGESRPHPALGIRPEHIHAEEAAPPAAA